MQINQIIRLAVICLAPSCNQYMQAPVEMFLMAVSSITSNYPDIVPSSFYGGGKQAVQRG